MLAADGLATEVEWTEWNGQPAEVFADSWVARTTTAAPATDLELAPGWMMDQLGEGFFSLWTPGASLTEVVGWAAQNPSVAYVEPDFAIAQTSVPNDPAFGSLWNLHNIGQAGGLVDADIDAPEAWSTTTGSRDVVVAVIDTGVDYTHLDLAANIWRNPGEIANDGIDNDGNGYVDDVSGWDFANRDADPMDDNGHGTHVAGTIGAVGGNSTGVVGVNWLVSIMPLKFLTASGSGSTSRAIAAINYATQMKRDFGINVVASNNSWGGGGNSTALRDAIAAGGSQGILFVTAAGNESTNIDAIPSYPASYQDSAIISVAATNRLDQLAGFSNFGRTSVDIAAPGVSIYSTVPGNAYALYSGTSMAAPHVTGVVALVAAANPGASAAEIRAAILSTATPVSGLARKLATGGVLNAAAAVAAIQPGSPGGSNTPNTTPSTPGEPSLEPPVVDVGQITRGALSIPPTVGSLEITGLIGDSRFGNRDVDMYRVVVRAGQTLVIDVSGESVGEASAVDSYVRVFNAAGVQVRANDNFAGSLDSRVILTPRRTNVFFIGVSGSGNSRYNPRLARNARPGSTGGYQLALSFGSLPGSRPAVDTVHLLGFADTRQQNGNQTSLFMALAALPFMPAASVGVTIWR